MISTAAAEIGTIVDERRHIIYEYDRKDAFASFLPGIAGPDGTPSWCFYTNRGQGVASFGHSDKHHPILEFLPADQAYQQTARLGFRTFLRDSYGCYREPFGNRDAGCQKATRMMMIGLSGLSLVEEDDSFRFEVGYATLPGEKYPALIRYLRITNISDLTSQADIIDGLPRLTPYGIGDGILKSMSTTAAAWIETDLRYPEVPGFRVRASIGDTVEVKPVNGCHFMVAVAEHRGVSRVLHPIVDPASIFGSDLSFSIPNTFRNIGLDGVVSQKPSLFSRFPSGFAPVDTVLEPGEYIDLYSMYGYASSPEVILDLKDQWSSGTWFREKITQYEHHVAETVCPFVMSTAWPNLDAYTLQTALDNTLRGGKPIVWGRGTKSRVFHLYSRKHGDMERDYNDFALPAQRYSAGLGNYRDMNQNRRIDVVVNPNVGTADIHLFVDLIQMDGYNPLIVKSGGFQLKEQMELSGLSNVFTPGDLLDAGYSRNDISIVLEASDYQPDADFGEGYWTDHWTYNLDLIDQYLRIYPDRERDLFFGETTYRWRRCGVLVRPLKERFKLVDGAVVPKEHLILNDRSGGFLSHRSSLLEKLAVLAVIKCATLGPSECGLEMEAGRPGWYDALNGLPGLFGSSLSDGVELLRLLHLLLGVMAGDTEQSICLPVPVWDLMNKLTLSWQKEDPHRRWMERWDARDEYRSKVAGYDVVMNSRPMIFVAEFLRAQELRLAAGLDSAAIENNGILPTYYRHDPTGWDLLETGFAVPSGFTRHVLPLFLEGAVKHMKISITTESKLRIHERVEQSPLFDRTLGMYVLNAPLEHQPQTIGRAKAFPEGWLENGSVWLHMEYKYLLELLRSGDGSLFWNTAKRCLVPFLDAVRYGRSPYENSSFIASSRYPVEASRGRGFIGRLSGATAEYLTMWSEFLLGEQPFFLMDGELNFQPKPVLPGDMFRDDGTLKFRLFGDTEIVYRNPKRRDLLSDSRRYLQSIITTKDGVDKTWGTWLSSVPATNLRNGVFDRLVVNFE
ncbi:MAG: hypothetical protein RQ801_00250 [Spirochaetaceae bacterium]|nr:hypothetical protein [Spirochaetaceae bacterium]MDT8296699.1 hypothetical protein [Spirochaetaceae bacterium]